MRGCDGEVSYHRPMNGKALLPGSSAKGSIRSQLEKIVRTLNGSLQVAPHRQPGEINEDQPFYLRHLFGMEDQTSGLWLSDFVANEPSRVQKQEMVAIDRWTGGVAEGAKFDAGYFEQPTLRGILRLSLPVEHKTQTDTKSVIGLVALLLRDLLAEKIAFGFGGNKGYGECQATVTAVRFGGPTPDAFLELVDENQPSTNRQLESICDRLIAGDAATIDQCNLFLNDVLAVLREQIACPVEAS